MPSTASRRLGIAKTLFENQFGRLMALLEIVREDLVDMTTRVRISVPLLLLLAMLMAVPASAQSRPYPNDFSGHWVPLFHEDEPDRGSGPALGQYEEMPINDDARARAMSWDASIQGLPEWRCRPHNADYAVRSPQHEQIWAVWDDITREVKEWRIANERASTDRVIYMDGRPHPSPRAPHTWYGFSTGEWIGDILKVTTTHLKEGYLRRNGVPISDQRTFEDYLIRRDDGYLTWVTIINDPVYLAEPWIWTTEFKLDPYGRVDAAPCVVSEEETRASGEGYGFVPHFLPGRNPYIDEFAIEYALPIEATRGGPETTRPDYREKMKAMPKPTASKP